MTAIKLDKLNRAIKIRIALDKGTNSDIREEIITEIKKAIRNIAKKYKVDVEDIE